MMKRQAYWAAVLTFWALLGPAVAGIRPPWPLARGMADLGALSTNPADPADKGISQARSLNDLGQVVGDSVVYNTGSAEQSSWTHAFQWTASQGMTDLGVPPGAANTDNTSATAINNAGQIAVNHGDMDTVAYIYAAGQWTKLGMPGASTAVNALNQKGEAAGGGLVLNQSTQTYEWHALKWSAAGAATELGQLPDAWWGSEAAAINETGLAAGWSTTSNACIHAVLWSAPAQLKDLGALLEPDPLNFNMDSYATGINNHGAVVGYYSGTATGGKERAFLWTAADGMKDLGALPGGDVSVAMAINDQGRVTGWANGRWQDSGGVTHEVIHAFLWANGRMRDLGPLGGATDPNYCDNTSRGYALNKLGQVAGQSTALGISLHGFFIDPKWPNPEPILPLLLLD